MSVARGDGTTSGFGDIHRMFRALKGHGLFSGTDWSSVSEIEFCTLYVVAERWILGCILRLTHAKNHFSDTLLESVHETLRNPVPGARQERSREYESILRPGCRDETLELRIVLHAG